jgi:ribosomal protein S3
MTNIISNNKKYISKWYTQINYQYIIHEDRIIRDYIYNIFKLYNPIFTNCIIKRNNKGIYIYINIYNSNKKFNQRKRLIIYNKNIRPKKIKNKKIQINKKKRRQIFYLSNYIFKRITFILSKKLGISIYLIPKYTIYLNANLISKYISNLLNKRIRFYKLYKEIYKLIKNIKRIYGFKFICSGRPNGKRIASIKIFKKGIISLNSFNKLIDYSISETLTKYGICSIKIWLIYKKLNIKDKLIKQINHNIQKIILLNNFNLININNIKYKPNKINNSFNFLLFLKLYNLLKMKYTKKK